MIHEEISKWVKICKRIVERVNYYLKYYNISKHSKIIPRGRSSKITSEMEQISYIFNDWIVYNLETLGLASVSIKSSTEWDDLFYLRYIWDDNVRISNWSCS